MYEFDVGTAFAFVIGLLLTLAGVAVLSTRRMSQRNIVHKVASQDAALNEHAALVPVGTTLSSSVIPEGDEEAGDDANQTDGLLTTPKLSQRSMATSGQEFEMADIGPKRGPAGSLPVLKSSAALSNFTEKAAEEVKEFQDLAATIDSTTSDLASKLAKAGYPTTNSPATKASVASVASSVTTSSSSSVTTSSDSPLPLLHPTAPVTIDPALAIQIEADQAYINRHESKTGISGLPVSQAAKKVKQQIESRLEAEHSAAVASVTALRHGADMDILNLASHAMLEGSPRVTLSRRNSLDGSLATTPSTPRSSYVQERERAASIASASLTPSGRTTPTFASVAIDTTDTPTRRLTGDETSASSSSNLDSVSPHVRAHTRQLSNVGHTPKVGPLPSAVFSGAFIESAQQLPDVDSDDRLQRLTRLSTVGHWVGGLHAQMPVAGGVVQAILQAKEMQAAIDGIQAMEGTPAKIGSVTSPPTPSTEEKKAAAAAAAAAASTDVKVDMPTAEPALTPGIELTDIKVVSHDQSHSTDSGSSSSTAASSSSSIAPSSSSSLQPSSSSPSTAPSSSSSSSATAANVNRTIQFDDDYVSHTHTHQHVQACLLVSETQIS